MSDAVLTRVVEGVGCLTLNRPARRNALSAELLIELAAAIEDFERRADVGAMLITGIGGSFCAGGDVQDFAARGGEGGDTREVDPVAVEQQRRAQRITVGALYESRKPVVAALPGAVAGAGIGLALAADLRVGDDSTFFLAAFAGVGLTGDFGATWLLHSIVGPAKARELLLLNDRVRAGACLELGLVNSLVADGELESASLALAQRLADGPSHAYAGMKANLRRASYETLAQSMDAEVPIHKHAGTTTDHRDAVHAFVRKEAPTFSRPWADGE